MVVDFPAPVRPQVADHFTGPDLQVELHQAAMPAVELGKVFL